MARTKKLKRLEQFYSISQAAELLDTPYPYFLRRLQIGDVPNTVQTYRWTHTQKSGSRVTMPESSLNILREQKGLEPVHTKIPRKRRYSLAEVAQMLSLKRATFYLEDSALAHDVGFESCEVVVLTHAELTRHFGERKIPPGDGRTVYDIDDAALLAGVDVAHIEELCDKGELTAVNRGVLGKRQVVSRERLLEWIETKRGAYDIEANIEAEKKRKRAYADRVKQKRAETKAAEA